jgi:myo-inositol-1(or 4)-monophosphatase
MPPHLTSRSVEWLAACQEISRRIEGELMIRPGRALRAPVVGHGEGGDDTTAIDQAAEDAVVQGLERLADGGLSFTLVSEELGTRVFGDEDSPFRIVVDPIDGSLNAKRGLGFFCVSIAIAEGLSLRDVVFGFVHDFGTGEEWVAERGAGATRQGVRLGTERPHAPLEIVVFEATSPPLVAQASARMPETVERVRVLGSLALALCQLAAGRVDAVGSLKPTRAVDIAAAQLLVREAGMALTLPGIDGDPLDAPLDLAARSRIVAAADEETCNQFAALLPVIQV